MFDAACKHRVHELAHAGTLKLLDAIAPGLANEEFQTAYVEIHRVMASLLLTYIALESRSIRAKEPSAN